MITIFTTNKTDLILLYFFTDLHFFSFRGLNLTVMSRTFDTIVNITIFKFYVMYFIKMNAYVFTRQRNS